MMQRLRSDAPLPRPAARVWSFSWLPPFALALALRVALAWVTVGPRGTPYSDPADYDTVAWNLARGVGFALQGANGPYPTAFVPPLLPWLTSLLYHVTGHWYFAAVLLQCVFGSLLPLALGAYGRAMFGGGVGRLACWLAVAHPLLVFFSSFLLTETLFTLLLVLALALSAEWVKTPRRGRAFGAGIVWGLASLTRPTALPIAGWVALWAWIPLGLTVVPRERLRQALLLFLGLGLTVLPWTLRNAAALHAFVPVTTGAGGALYVGNNESVWSQPELRGGGGGGAAWDQLARGEFRGASETEVDRRARARAIAFLQTHVAEWPAMAAAKLARFWRLTAEGGGTGSWQSGTSPLARLLQHVDPFLVWSLVMLPFAIWGALQSLRGARRWFQSLSLWVIAYFTLIAVVFFGSLRMRMPIEPLVVLLAAAGFEDARRRLRSRQRGLKVIPGGRQGV